MVKRKIGYNIALGGDGGDTISNHPRKKEISEQHSRSMKSYHEKNPKERKKYVKKKDDPNWVNPNKGRKREYRPLYVRRGIPNPEHSEWMKKNNPFKGKTPSKENLNRFIEMVKQPKTMEHKKKLSEANKGNKPPNMRKISVNGIEYESLTHASKILKIPLSTIKNRLKSNNVKFENYKYI